MMAPLGPATLLNAMRRNGCGFGEEPVVRLLPNVRPTNRLNARNRKAIGADNVFGCQEARLPRGDLCVNRFTPICAKQHLVASFWRADYRADRTPVEGIVIPTPAGWQARTSPFVSFQRAFFRRCSAVYPVALLRFTPVALRKEDVAYSRVAAVFMHELRLERTT